MDTWIGLPGWVITPISGSKMSPNPRVINLHTTSYLPYPEPLSRVLAVVGHQKGDYDPDLLAYVARRSMELMRSFTGQNLATIIWATWRCKCFLVNYYLM